MSKFASKLFISIFGLLAVVLSPAMSLAQAAKVVPGDFDGLLKDSKARGNLISFKDQLFLGGPIFEEGNRFRRVGLWKVDYETSSVELIKETGANGRLGAPHDFIIFKDQLFFVAKSQQNFDVIWKSDGTPEGTVMLEDLKNGIGLRVESNPRFFVFNENLFFVSSTGNNDGPVSLGGIELWKTDGTSQGSGLVRDISGDQSSSSPYLFTDFNGEALFFNGISSARGLWKTDGTEAGTSLIRNFPTAQNFHFPSVFNSKLVFIVQTESNGGYQFWESDGTETGTKQVVLNTESSFKFMDPRLVLYQSKLFFVARSGDLGVSLWNTDGSESGTKEVKVIDPTFSNERFGFDPTAIFQDELFFLKGGEIWKTDGTEEGSGKLFGEETLSFANLFSTQEGLFYLQTERNINAKVVKRYNGNCVSDVVSLESTEGFTTEKMVEVRDKIYFPNALETGNASEIWEIDLTYAWPNEETIWYLDSDGDGFGDSNSSLIQCDQPVGYVSDSDDCDDTDASVNVDCVTGIEEDAINEIGMITFPNPTSDLINISFRNNKNSAFGFRLLNGQGNVAISKEYDSGNSVQFNSKRVPTGLYFVEILLEGKKYAKRVIIN